VDLADKGWVWRDAEGLRAESVPGAFVRRTRYFVTRTQELSFAANFERKRIESTPAAQHGFRTSHERLGAMVQRMNDPPDARVVSPSQFVPAATVRPVVLPTVQPRV
jgi:hypothetical protein